jgi:hypothetical protein
MQPASTSSGEFGEIAPETYMLTNVRFWGKADIALDCPYVRS